MRLKKILLAVVSGILFLLLGFLLFILNETKDEINATPLNIESKLQSILAEQKIAGCAISVFNSDHIIYSNGFGFSDLQNQTRYTEQTEQYIASISKTMIGVSLLKAQELGLIDLNESINNYLPFEVINPNFPSNTITLLQLATHTSSLTYNDSVVESLYVEGRGNEQSLETFMLSYFKNGDYGSVSFGNYEPGSTWDYSNIGASLAAYIIERQAQMPFSDFTQKHIMSPLKMNQTHWFQNQSNEISHSLYYEIANESLQEVKTSGVQLYPSRDLITTVSDLTKFGQAMLSKNNMVLSDQSYQTLLSPTLGKEIKNRDVDNCGLFFMIDRNQYGVTYSLTGMNGGDYCINTMMWFDQKTQMGYIFIGNTGGSKANRSSHIRIFRTLSSLGNHTMLNNPESSAFDKFKFRLYNYYSRINGLF